MISGKEMADIQKSEQKIQDVERFCAIDRWPNERSKTIQAYYKIRNNITKGPNGEIGVQLETFKPFPPEFLTDEILKEYHDKSGHPGISQTLDGISRKYFIPNLREVVTEYIRSCDRCQRVKPMTNPLNAPLGHVLPPAKPFDRFAIDLIGPLPITNRHYKYICVSTDLFSKKTYAQPLRSKNPGEILRATMSEWLGNPHMPTSLLMDNGKEFTALKEACEAKGIRVFCSPAYHPQTNGECENRNRTIKSRLRLMSNFINWDEHLPYVIHQMNSAKHSVTKLTPFEIETGFEGENPTTLIGKNKERIL